jgi:lantibiotic leader peptide-processing serine protease
MEETMAKRFFTITIILALALASFSSSASAAPPARSYLIVAASEDSLPAGLGASVAQAGGILVRSIPQVGLAVAESSSSNFQKQAAKIAGIKSVNANIVRQMIKPVPSYEFVEAVGNPPYSGADDRFFDLLWGMTAIQAPAAWNAGYMGAGVRVAVLDDGIDADNPDLAPNLNTALSASFVPGEDYNVHAGVFFNHGTHVAGTIAAADNTFGVIGVAPQAELVAVKVLSEYTGSGAFDWLISGIIYATDIQADVINMSLGAVLVRSGYLEDNGTPDSSDDYWVSANEVAELFNALGRATTYAYQHGVTVIASAMNDNIDRDHDANLLVLPGDAPHVIQIAATAPTGWAKDPLNTFLDNHASYSNYGQSRINFAAPGGDVQYLNINPTEMCTVAGITARCFVFDLVLSNGTCQGANCLFVFASGTSMAAPHASGVAALIIGKNGGSMHPAQVQAALAAAANDLGKPGNDDFYGAGRVNAYNAVK